MVNETVEQLAKIANVLIEIRDELRQLKQQWLSHARGTGETAIIGTAEAAKSAAATMLGYEQGQAEPPTEDQADMARALLAGEAPFRGEKAYPAVCWPLAREIVNRWESRVERPVIDVEDWFT